MDENAYKREVMTMADITYCTKLFCKNTECERHFDNIAEVEYGSRISFAEFTECEFWESEE